MSGLQGELAACTVGTKRCTHESSPTQSSKTARSHAAGVACRKHSILRYAMAMRKRTEVEQRDLLHSIDELRTKGLGAGLCPGCMSCHNICCAVTS